MCIKVSHTHFATSFFLSLFFFVDLAFCLVGSKARFVRVLGWDALYTFTFAFLRFRLRLRLRLALLVILGG